MTETEERQRVGFRKVPNETCSTCESREYTRKTEKVLGLVICEVYDRCGLSETKFAVKKTSVCDFWSPGKGYCIGEVSV